VTGTYHHISEAHIGRYRAEFDLRDTIRAMTDAERTAEAIKGARGKPYIPATLLAHRLTFTSRPGLAVSAAIVCSGDAVLLA
jgi:hypothetical protein